MWQVLFVQILSDEYEEQKKNINTPLKCREQKVEQSW